MNSIKKIAVLLIISTMSISFSASAKEYVVGFKKDSFKKATTAKSFMGTNTFTVRVFENLEMMVVDVNSKRDLFKLKSDSDVDFVETVNKFKAPRRINSLPGVVQNSYAKRLVDYPWGILEVDAPAAWPHSRSGEGVKVLVLDTGIDKDHPNIASRFVEGRNLIPGEGNPDAPYPYFDDGGHGTHVAGSILADGFGSGVVGVAPQASLYSGKVCQEYCDGTAIMAGIDWAIGEGIHVVNMSLGGAAGNAAGAAMYKKAEEANVVVIAASGNDGRNQISYPSKYPHVLSVGAIDEARNVAEFSNWDSDLDVVAPGVNVLSTVPQGTGRSSKVNFDVNGSFISASSFPMDGSVDGVVEGMEVQYVGLGKPEDFEGVDLTGKIALISRGEIAFADKARGAMEANASAVVIFNNVEGELRGTLGGPLDIVVAGIEKSSGEAIVAALEGGENGPEETLVTSNVEVGASDYEYLAGTSMATPHVAGVAALVRSTNPELTAVQVKEIIKSTVVAAPVDNSDHKYGKGIVNAFKAVEEALQN